MAESFRMLDGDIPDTLKRGRKSRPIAALADDQRHTEAAGSRAGGLVVFGRWPATSNYLVREELRALRVLRVILYIK
jgi:hypothetical protein